MRYELIKENIRPDDEGKTPNALVDILRNPQQRDKHWQLSVASIL